MVSRRNKPSAVPISNQKKAYDNHGQPALVGSNSWQRSDEANGDYLSQQINVLSVQSGRASNMVTTTSPSCSWDKQNLLSFLSFRSQMLSVLHTSNYDSKSINGVNHLYARSQSTSALKTQSIANKEFVRSPSTLSQPVIDDDTEGGNESIFDLLPTNEDYFSKSVCLLFDTPLPLLIENDTIKSNNEPALVHIRQPRQNESTFLLPRTYLRTWFEWARASIINSSIQQWRLHHDIHTSSTFSLDPNTLQTLAALSILADQYELYEKEAWKRWMTNLEISWKTYLEKKTSFSDEKKDEELYNGVFLPIKPPGAMDARLLASYGYPLLLRTNISLVMGGISSDDENNKVLSGNEELREEALVHFLSRDKEFAASKTGDDNRQRLAVCPVSSSFYEWTRSTLGVICDDNMSISFQPSKAQTESNGDYLRDSSSLLYYKQYSNSTAANKIKKDTDIPQLKFALSQLSPIEFQRRILPTIRSSSKKQNVGSGTSISAALSPNKQMSSYSKLMNEAFTSLKEDGQDITPEEIKSYTVEVHPIEFRFIVSDQALPRSGTINKDSKSAYSTNGIALISRIACLSDALNDFKQHVECNRSSACVRLWKKNLCAETAKMRGATARGDGYDLIDPKLLDTAGDEKLTVEKWLRLDNESRGATSGPFKVDILVEIRSSPTSRWGRESLELQNRLQVGDYVDAQDTALKWYEAVVREISPDSVKVHYFGWGSRWDGLLPRRKGIGTQKLSPPMPLWSKTSRWRERIKTGQEVEVRQTASPVYRPKWYRATVIAIRRESDSNPLEITGGAELEMIGDDNKSPLKLLHRKRQVLVRVPQEKNNCATPPPLQEWRDDGTPIEYPPYIRWIDLYGEEICEANTHINFSKQSDAPATVTYAMGSQRTQPVEVMKSFNNLHGAGFVRESLRGVPPAPGSVGLHNLGNSCYMNSILQCINHISPITQYFLKGDYAKHVNKKNPLGSGGRVATAYASFLSEIWTGEYSILAPRTLKQTVGFFAPQFNNNYQHDSQEFCQYLMDGLHEDLNKVIIKPYVEHIEANGMKDEDAALQSWKRHLLRHDSVFVDYTQGMHRSHLTCPNCGKESIKFDVYSSISLPLVPSKGRTSITLTDCLDQFAAGEQLDEHNAWYCSRCMKHVCALKLITLWNTPDILVLHLKRFTFEKCPTHDGRLIRRKIEDKVDFPIERLDLSSYILGPKHDDAPPIYKLFGVSEHTGPTANSGHYTATVRNSKDGNWYRYNDSHVGSTSGDAAVTGGAYLLFYQREKGSLRWAGMDRQMGLPDADGFTEVRDKRKKKHN